jgi:hypothetical protein
MAKAKRNPFRAAKTVTAAPAGKIEVCRIEYYKNGKRFFHEFDAERPFVLAIRDDAGKTLHNYALLDLHAGRFIGGEFHN